MRYYLLIVVNIRLSVIQNVTKVAILRRRVVNEASLTPPTELFGYSLTIPSLS